MTNNNCFANTATDVLVSSLATIIKSIMKVCLVCFANTATDVLVSSLATIIKSIMKVCLVFYLSNLNGNNRLITGHYFHPC